MQGVMDTAFAPECPQWRHPETKKMYMALTSQFAGCHRHQLRTKMSPLETYWLQENAPGICCRKQRKRLQEGTLQVCTNVAKVGHPQDDHSM